MFLNILLVLAGQLHGGHVVHGHGAPEQGEDDDDAEGGVVRRHDHVPDEVGRQVQVAHQVASAQRVGRAVPVRDQDLQECIIGELKIQ